MTFYRKAEQLAKKFDAAYPGELSERLRWWSKALGIHRARLLHMLGMSARQAAKEEGKDLKEILQVPAWEANAQLLEGTLHRLLALFRYDWHALAERIHGPEVLTEEREPSRVTSRQGEVEGLRSTPNGVAADLLLDRMAEGGPQSLAALLAYLATSPAGTHPVGF